MTSPDRPLPALTDAAILVRSVLPRISTPEGITLRLIRAATADLGLPWHEIIEAVDELILHRLVRFTRERAYWWENDPGAPAGYYDRGPYIPTGHFPRTTATEGTPVN